MSMARFSTMAQNLNQKIESEIKELINDKSYYVCRGEQISIVTDINVNLNDDYAMHMSDTVIFNGSAEFGFLISKEEKPDIYYSHHNFTGNATLDNFKVVKVGKPIFIHK